MIVCPNCQEEIEDDSHYCDQCGTALRYCNRCGRVGLGRRCTSCGGMMVVPDDLNNSNSQTAYSTSMSASLSQSSSGMSNQFTMSRPPQDITHGLPSLALINASLGIRIEAVNGAVIGRKQGPYAQFFKGNMYVSGVHAQLRYNAKAGWCIADKHSSNGTKLNERPLQPDIEMSLKDGDIVTIANVNLQVSIN